MNGWSALSSIFGTLAFVVFMVLLFCSDGIAEIIRAWRQK